MLAPALLFCFIISIGGLLTYWIYFLAAFNAISQKNSTETVFKKGVSVIVCSKNEQKNLETLLPLLLAQEYSLFEVLVVDDHSTDQTKTVVEHLQKDHPQLKYLKFEQEKLSKGKKEVLAYGIENASHDYLLLTDADCLPSSKEWISEMSKGFDKNNLIIGLSTYNANSPLSHFIRLDSLLLAVQYLVKAIKGKPYMSVGRNVAYTKELYKKSGGFSKHLNLSSGDDDLFIQDAYHFQNCCVQLNNKAHTYTDPPKNLSLFFNQKTRHQSTGKKYRASTLVYLGAYQLLIFTFYASFVSLLFTGVFTKWLLLSFIIKKSVQAGVFRRIFVKIGVEDHPLTLILFEVPWLIFTGLVNIRSLFFSKKRW